MTYQLSYVLNKPSTNGNSVGHVRTRKIEAPDMATALFEIRELCKDGVFSEPDENGSVSGQSIYLGHVFNLNTLGDVYTFPRNQN